MKQMLACTVCVAALSSSALMQDATIVTNPQEHFSTRVLVSGLEGPWEVAWGPDRQLWVTERTGRRVVRINPADGTRSVAVTIPEVNQSVTQDGLLGLAFHADLLRGTGNDFVYVVFTYDDAPGTALARRMAIRRYRYDQGAHVLVEPVDILTGLPTHDDHVGGRLAFGPDAKLYLTIGDQGSNFGANRCNRQPRAGSADAQPRSARRTGRSTRARSSASTLTDPFPSDNPEISGVRSHVFSFGHRNPLGLAFGPGGKLYESEHGPSSDDEINLIEAGRNYGWPNVAGRQDDKAYVYANWSASSPQPCASLPRGTIRSRRRCRFRRSARGRTRGSCRRFGHFSRLRRVTTCERSAAAPSRRAGIDVYTGDAIPGWKNSLLALSLIRGVVYRLTLAADGRSTVEPPTEMFKSANRYRDIALNPDGRTLYLATDVSGPSRNAAGVVTQTLANPGSILALTYSER